MFSKLFFTLFFLGIVFSAYADETVQFNPPTGWHIADESLLTSNVKYMVIGKGKHDYPPSINLAVEEFNGTLKDYLKIVKSINTAQGTEWKDLGKIRTEAGTGSLSQLDQQTNWGPVRKMHVILVHGGHVYILTAACIKDEFPEFYKEFFNAMISLRFVEEAKGQ